MVLNDGDGGSADRKRCCVCRPLFRNCLSLQSRRTSWRRGVRLCWKALRPLSTVSSCPVFYTAVVADSLLFLLLKYLKHRGSTGLAEHFLRTTPLPIWPLLILF